jgi:hypothetical protein
MRGRLKLGATLLTILLPAAAHAQLQRPGCHGVVRGTVMRIEGIPASGLEVQLWPIALDFDLVLPRERTDANGQYVFDHVCAETYSVVASDEKAGYSTAGPRYNRLLYGGRIQQAVITEAGNTVEFDFTLPPKPALLLVRARNKATNKVVTNFDIRISAGSHREITYEACPDCEEKDRHLFPPDTNVTMKISAKGFRTWAGPDGKKKTFRAQPGEKITVDVLLEPVMH